MNFNAWKQQWLLGNKPDDTEIYNDFILKTLFSGTPNNTWSEDKFLLFHITGKSIEGIVRNVVCFCPIMFIEPYLYTCAVASGVLWGFLWYFAEVLPRVGSLTSWNLGEIFTGFLTFFLIGVMLYS